VIRSFLYVETSREEGLVHGFFTNMAVFPEDIKGSIDKFAAFLAKVDQEVSRV
jgi:acetyl esterase